MSNWKGAEREIAKILTKQLSDVGKDFLMRRIPILGREGPDLTFPNPFHLVIDVKSRLKVPKGLFKCIIPGQWRWLDARTQPMHTWPLYWACSLEDFGKAVTDNLPNPNKIDITTYSIMWKSVVVHRWLEHIQKHAKQFVDDQGNAQQFGALILHRPRMPYGKSVVLIDGMDMISRGVRYHWMKRGFRKEHTMEEA